jgi:glycine oxidase
LLQLGVSSLSLFDDFMREIDAGADAVTEYRRSGSLQVARSASHAVELSRSAARLSALGVQHSLLTGDDVRSLEPALAEDIVSGLLVPVHGYVHVTQLMSALTRGLERRGVTCLVDRVKELVPEGPGVRVVTEGTSLIASAVVVAAGSWSGQLAMLESPPIPVRPIRGQIVEMAFSSTPLSHVVWGEDCYLVPWQDGSVSVGATVEDVGFDERSTPGAVQSLIERGRSVLPRIGSASMARVRVGLRPATRDELPLIGWSSTMPCVCLATGHYRNGILLAPLTGKLVADIVTGVDDPAMRWAREAVVPSRLGL